MNTKGFVLIGAFILSNGFCQISAQAQERKVMSFNLNRYDKLKQAIQTEDNFLIRMRAIQELEMNYEKIPETKEILIQHLFSSNLNLDFELFDLARVLASADSSVVTKLISEFEKQTPSDDIMERLLITLGQMGTKAKIAIPFLTSRMDKSTLETREKIQVVLANIGYESKANQQILIDIKQQNEKGEAAIWMMALAGMGDWVDSEIVPELKPGSFKGKGIFALWAYANKDSSTAKKMKIPFKTSFLNKFKGTKCEDIFYSFVLAKINPDKSEKHLNNALAGIADISSDWREGLPLAKMLVKGILADPILKKMIIQKVHDKNTDVAKGAMWMLWTIGFSIHEAAPDLFNVLHENENEELREVSATVLGMLADYSDLSKLQDLLANENPSKVRNKIKESINILQLGKGEP